jgi:hypothetical protein
MILFIKISKPGATSMELHQDIAIFREEAWVEIRRASRGASGIPVIFFQNVAQTGFELSFLLSQSLDNAMNGHLVQDSSSTRLP